MNFFMAALSFALFLALLWVGRELVKAKGLAARGEALLAEKLELQAKLEAAVAARFEAEKQASLAEQKLADQEVRMKDWDAQRQETIKTVTAATTEVSNKISSKLLEDHKREQEAAKKEQEERVQKVTAGLLEQVTTLGKNVASLKDDSVKNTQQVQTMWRALTNPASAGQLAEVGLENALKNLGLEKGRDFIMQFTVPGQGGEGRLRPDAVVFLPQNTVMVVDSKASKFLMELAEAEGTEQEPAIRAKLVATMHKHLKDLAAKDYKTAVAEAFKAAGKTDQVGDIHNVMYLPSEGAWEKLRDADPELQSQLEKAGLICAGPATLMGLFSLAKLRIAEARQMDNHYAIVEAAGALVESVGTMVGHMDKVGKGISGAMNAFNDVASSTNARIIPRIRKLVNMGVKAPKTKELPPRVQTYDIRRQDELHVIDGEATEVEPAEKPLALTGNSNS